MLVPLSNSGFPTSAGRSAMGVLHCTDQIDGDKTPDIHLLPC
jgi:hypothetical protein